MNIILIGFMGCGKTTVGKALALKTGMDFLDTDDLIQKKLSLSIKDIFAQYGENFFRDVEKQVIAELVGIDNTVVSVGGGAVMNEENFSTLKQIGATVFLNTSFEKILKNLEGGFRPLIGNTIDREKVSALLEYRLPTYMKADFCVATDNLNVEQTIDAVLQKLKLNL